MGERGPKGKYTYVSCPNEQCQLFAQTDKGNIVSRGNYRSKSGYDIRKFQCKKCGHIFNSRTGSAFEGLRTPEKEVVTAIRCLNEGSGIRQTGRIVDHSKDTVQKWAAIAGEHCAKVNESAESDMDSSYIQFDELTATLKKNLRK